MLNQNNKIKTIAIIGGGFSGAILTYHLINLSSGPLNIKLIDREGAFANGLAYSTPDPYHLLNVVAGKMGAVAGDNEHFYKWLCEKEDFWRKKDLAFADIKLNPNAFISRKLYGIYINDLLNDALKIAPSKSINVELIKLSVVDIDFNAEDKENNFTLFLESEEKLINVIKADKVVMAVGSFPSKDFPIETYLLPEQTRYIKTLWDYKANPLFKKNDLSDISENESIVIIGTGLTMVDAVVSLNRLNFRGKIIAISRNGQISRSHLIEDESEPIAIDYNNLPSTALGLLKNIKKEVKNVNNIGKNWRAVIDALRPITITRWQLLDNKEKRKVIKHLFLWWNIHRHRIPSGSAELLNNLQDAKKFEIIKASVTKMLEKNNDYIEICFRKKGGEEEVLKAKYVINCSGIEVNIEKSGNPLLVKMKEKKMIYSDPLALGIQVDEKYMVKGIASEKLYAFGPILLGQLFETIAVPELREQALEVARNLLAGLIPNPKYKQTK